ncbi:MAG: response regulator [Candidatus Krumholzibacteria bacterium]|nr:response regulator [Candidatus Krumholzibacteria bacterium]
MTVIDEELSQSRARVVITGICLLVFSVVGVHKGLAQSDQLVQGLVVCLLYLIFSVSWYVMVYRLPGKWPMRRYVTILADLGIMTYWLHFGDKHVASYYPIFLWVIIGNGIRFGERHLKVGIVTGTLGFGSLLIFNDFWKAHMEIGAGMLLGVLVLPIFFLSVLRRLRTMSQLEIALAKSRLADKAKDQFLATMSHEIRTPMNGVLGMAETLRATDLNDDQQEHLHIITRSVESLLHIINDILDYSKITSNSLRLETTRFDLKQVLGDVHLLMKSTAEAKGIDFVFDYPADSHRDFMGDPTRIRQIVFNLVGNAIKFTQKGRVELSCRINKTGGRENVSIQIADTGIGIPTDRLAAVFDQFEQADNSTTRQFGGTGLGLAISRTLAIMMGGDVEVNSVLGQGSTFTVAMTLDECEAKAIQEEPETGALPNFGMRGLVAEDNKFNQVVVKSMLERIGIAVDLAENGEEALELFNRNHYDLVFMDVRMPIMNGYDCTEAIRGRGDDRANVPILALTAEATKSDAEKCLAAGMDVHLSKPLRITEVVKAISSLENLPTLTV